MPDDAVPTNGATFHYQKTPCGRGACPTFTLFIYADGRAVYDGQRNTARAGVWERRLSPTEMNVLRNRFEQSGFWQLQARYDGNIQDISGVYLSYSKGRRTKQVLNRETENPPAAFQQVAAALDALVSSGQWTQPGTQSSPETAPTKTPRITKPMTPPTTTPAPASPEATPTTPTRTIRRR